MKLLRLLWITLLTLSSVIVLAQSNVLQLNDVEANAGDQITVETEITNDDAFVGFQFDVPLPAGFSYVNGTLQLFRQNPGDHIGNATVLPGNILRILVFSFLNIPFLGNEGVVATFNLNTPAIPGEYTLNLQNATIGNALGQNILTATIPGVVTLTGETPTFDVTVTVVPGGAGTVTGEGEYEVGDDVTLTATPADGFFFVNWSDGDGVVSTDNPYIFEMPAEDVELDANFAAVPTYTVTVNVVPGGSGSVTGAGTYEEGDPVTLTANPGTGFFFVNWTDGGGIVSTANPYNFVMPAANVVLNANFAPVPTFLLTVNVNPPGTGTVIGAGVYEEGDIVNLIANAAVGYEFVNWTDDEDNVISTANPYSFAMPDQDLTYTANFQELTETFEVTFNVDMTGAAGFNPLADDVYLSGTFNGFAPPGSDPDYMMEPIAPGSMTYTLTLDLTMGTYEYKYFYLDNGVTPVPEWPAGNPNRVFYCEEDMVLNDVWGVQTNIAIIHDATVFVDADDILVELEILNSSVFTAFQFDITLPVGFTYQPGSIAFTGRETDHNILANQAGQTLVVFANSPTNDAFMGNSGNVATFVLDFTAPAGVYPLNFAQAIISDLLGNNVTSGIDNGVLTILAHQNILEVVDTEVLTGNQMTVPIAITNTQEFTAFQLDIQLPVGFTYVAGSIALDMDRAVDHTIAAQVLAGNVLRVICFSDENTLFLGNAGDVATFLLNTPPNPGPGPAVYPAPISNATISNADGDDILTGTDDGVLTILPEQNIIEILDATGLCNRDELIEVVISNTQDFVAFQLDVPLPAGFTYVPSSVALNPARITNHTVSANVLPGNILRILGNSPTNALFLGDDGVIATFELHTSTIPGMYPLEVDNGVISDPLAVNILTGTIDGSITIINRNLMIIHDASQLVDHPVNIELEIDNTQDFVAFQCDITLPAGFTYVGGSAVLDPARAVNHTVTAAMQPGNVLRLIATSPTNALFLGFDGTICTFTLNTPGLPGPYDLTLSGEIISSPAPPVNLWTGSDDGVVTLLPDVNCPDDFAVCIDADPFVLTGGTPVGGVYTGPGVTGGMFYPAVAGAGIHEITYTYTYPNLISGFCTFFITVNPLPVVTCPDDFSVCYEGDPWMLYGGEPEGGTYSGDGVAGGMFDPVAAGTGPHLITYTYTDGNGCTNFCEFTITVYDPFAASIAEDQTICYNTAPDELTSTVTGGAGNYTYQWWTWDEAPVEAIEGATEATYQPPALMVTTSYVLQVFDDCGMIITDPVTITVYDEFLASIAEDQTICYNTAPEELTSIVAGGAGVYTYQWWIWDEEPVEAIGGATEATYQPPALTETTSYVLQVFDDPCGMIITNPVTITVYDEFLASIAADQTICYNTAPEELTSIVTGGAGVYTYQWWTWDGAPLEAIEGATEATYQPPALMETTSYVLQVFDDPCGMVITDPVTITVYDEFLASIAEDQTICYNTAPEELTSTVSGGAGVYTYQWWIWDEEPIEAIEGATEATYQPPALTETTSYVLQVFDDPCGMIITDPVTITVYDEFLASIAEDQTICYNTAPDELTSTVSGGAGVYTYQWWIWDGEPVEAIEGATEATYQPPALTETTSYVLQVFDDPCGMIITDPVTITVYDELMASIAEDQTICYNTAPEELTSTVSGGAGVYTYQWWIWDGEPVEAIEGATEATYQPPALTETTSFVLQVFDDPCGMVITDPVTITVYDELLGSIAADQTICYNTVPEELTSEVTGGAGVYTYQWWIWDGEPVEAIEGATEATYQPPALMETTSYVLQVFDDPCGMIITDPVTITVYDEFMAEIAADQTICYNTVPEELTSTVTGGAGDYEYQWQVFDEEAELDVYAEYTYTYPDLTDPASYEFNSWTEIEWADAVVPADENVVVSGVTVMADMLCSDNFFREVTLYLESPSGTTVELWEGFEPDGCVTDFVFTTTAFDGEETEGQWIVYFTDSYGDGGGTAYNVTLTIGYYYTITGLWVDIAEATGPTYQPEALTEDTMYRLFVTDMCGEIITDPVTITVYDEFLASIAADQTICYNTAPEELTSTVSGGAGVYTYQWWIWDGEPVEAIEGATEATYQPPALMETTSYVLQVFDDPCGMIITDPVTITVYDDLMASIAADQTICYNTVPEMLTSDVTGGAGEYTYQWWIWDEEPIEEIEGATEATYQPPALMETTSYVLQVIDPCGMVITDPVTITVYDEFLATIEADQTICYNTVPEELTSTVSGGAGVYTYQWWIWDGEPVEAIEGATESTYQPPALMETTSYVLQVFDDPCGMIITDPVTIAVYDDLMAEIAADQLICYNTEPEPLTSVVSGGAGNYSYQWQKFIADEEIVYAEYTYSYPDLSDPFAYEENSWDEIGWADAVVPPAENVTVSGVTVTASELCTDYWWGEVAMFLKSPAGTVVQIWQGFAAYGCEEDFEFTTDAFDGESSEGQWIVYFTDSYGDGGGSAFGVELTIGYYYIIAGIWVDIGGATAATYQPGPMTEDMMFRLHVTDECGEVFTDPVTITVTPLPEAYAGEDGGFCETDTYTLNGSAVNYSSVMWTTAGDGTFNDATLLNATYTPGTQDIAMGDVDLTLTAYALNDCPDIATDMVTLTIGLLPTVYAGDDGLSCEDTYYQTLGWTNNAWTILWTTDGDGYFDDATSTLAKYFPGSGDIASGSVVLTLTAQPVPPCTTPVSDNVVVTFQGLPSAYAGPDATVCGNATYQLSGSASDYSSAMWSTSGDGTFNNPGLLNAIYTPGAGDIANGSAVLTLTAYAVSPCATNATDNMTLTIIPLPSVSAGPDDAVCGGDNYVLADATASGYGSVTWTTSGTGTFVNPNVINATYQPSNGDIADGSVVLTLTATAIAPCSGTDVDNMTLTIVSGPTADAGDDFAICSNTTAALAGAATNYESVKWTTSGDGTFNNSNILNPVYTPGNMDIMAGEVELTLTAYAEAPCSEDAVDKIVVTIAAAATANAGADDKICANQTYTLDGSASGYFYTEWTSSGDGTFDDNTLLNATYYPGPTDILLGYVDLTLTSWPIDPCPDPASDMMVLLIDPLPDMPGTPTGPDFVCVITTDTTWYTTVGSPNALSYVWDIFPPNAGTIEGDGTTGIVTWSDTYFGPVFIRVKGLNDCGEGEFSEPFEVTTDPCTGIDEDPTAKLTLTVYPNPSDGKFKVEIVNIRGKLEMSLMDMTGQILRQETINSVSGLYRTELDITTYPKGIYFLRLYGDNFSKVERLILR